MYYLRIAGSLLSCARAREADDKLTVVRTRPAGTTASRARLINIFINSFTVH